MGTPQPTIRNSKNRNEVEQMLANVNKINNNWDNLYKGL